MFGLYAPEHLAHCGRRRKKHGIAALGQVGQWTTNWPHGRLKPAGIPLVERPVHHLNRGGNDGDQELPALDPIHKERVGHRGRGRREGWNHPRLVRAKGRRAGRGRRSLSLRRRPADAAAQICRRGKRSPSNWPGRGRESDYNRFSHGGYPTTRSTASTNCCRGTPSRHQVPKLTTDPPGAVTPDAYSAQGCAQFGNKMVPMWYLNKIRFCATKEKPRYPVGITGIFWLRG